MLNIYTEKPSTNYIEDVEAFFDIMYKRIYSKPFTADIIKFIDGAEIIHEGVLKTKFGYGTLLDISTGSKAVLVALSFPDYVVNFIEAGDNIANKALDLSADYDLSLYMDHSWFFSVLDDRQIKVDGELTTVGVFVLSQEEI